MDESMKTVTNVSVTFICYNCGAKPATLTLPDDYTDESLASCKSCGFVFGEFGKIKAEARKRVEFHERGEFILDTIRLPWGKFDLKVRHLYADETSPLFIRVAVLLSKLGNLFSPRQSGGR